MYSLIRFDCSHTLLPLRFYRSQQLELRTTGVVGFRVIFAPTVQTLELLARSVVWMGDIHAHWWL